MDSSTSQIPAPSQSERFDAIASWFLGPRAENFQYLENFFKMAMDAQRVGRNSYFPNDKPYITSQMQASSAFKENMEKLTYHAEVLSSTLAQHHVPFWNPRYNAHMSMDTTMPGIIGYLISMIYNQNNVAVEASPYTTFIEQRVGFHLCKMIGINVDDETKPKGWGHITCDGSVANMESVWAARNLKFYPLSLTLAIEQGQLGFIANSFKLPTCQGVEKLFKDFTTWELLNITPDVVLDIPDRLYTQYSISQQFLTSAMHDYIVQTTPKDDDMFEKRFGRENINHIAYVATTTMHYSWPKSTAVTGIGSKNVIAVTVDDDARMDMADLRNQLDKCLNEKRAVYTVVAIIGSTEHGACDPLKDIVDIRTEYQKKGLSFALHADGAWGTYFHSILNAAAPLNPTGRRSVEDNLDTSGQQLPSGFPYQALKPKTRESLLHLRFCESITVDPHKSGYIQYPAGGLLYRDGRMRYLVTWTSPVVYRNDAESMGVYGIEGSKPGAAPCATFVSHCVLGLDNRGYGSLLAEGIFSCVKMYAHLITMSTPETDFRVRTLIKPPIELVGQNDNPDLAEVRDLVEKNFYEDDEGNSIGQYSQPHRRLITMMGSDLAINTFAVNFRVNGEINTDVDEANELNTRIFKQCSIADMMTDINTRPVILTSTVLSQKTYQKCLTHFKERLGLSGDGDLYVLINVVSSPFPMIADFTRTVANDLRNIIEKETKISQMRNTISPTYHGFIMQGTDSVYLTHLPMFNMADHRYQLIITGELPQDVMEKYVAGRKAHPGQYFTLANATKAVLEDMVSAGEFDAVIDIGMPPSDGSHFISGFKLTNIHIIKMARLNKKYLSTYPKKSIPFYLYGKSQLHIDHALLASPNIQANSDCVTIKNLTRIDGSTLPLQDLHCDATVAASKAKLGSSAGVGSPYVMHLVNFPEFAMQPFPTNAQIAGDKSFFFKAQAEYEIAISRDVSMTDVIAKGIVQLSDTIFTDTDMLNEDPSLEEHVEAKTMKLHSSFHRYSHEPTCDEPQVPLLEKADVSSNQRWYNYVAAMSRGDEEIKKGPNFVAQG